MPVRNPNVLVENRNEKNHDDHHRDAKKGLNTCATGLASTEIMWSNRGKQVKIVKVPPLVHDLTRATM
jgi:hypothetical protein